MEMRQRGWRIGFLSSPVISRLSLNSVNICASSREVDRFYVVWNDNLLHSLQAFLFPVSACSLQTKKKVKDFKLVQKKNSKTDFVTSVRLSIRTEQLDSH